MWLRFLSDYCPDVPYIIKIDDDVIMNVFSTMRFLEEQVALTENLLDAQRTIICRIIHHRAVDRNNSSKWSDLFVMNCKKISFTRSFKQFVQEYKERIIIERYVQQKNVKFPS